MKATIAGVALVAALSIPTAVLAEGCFGARMSPTAETTTTATPVQTAQGPVTTTTPPTATR